MSPNMTSQKLSNLFSSYFWTAIMALMMAVFLSQWAVADPPVEADPPTATSEEAAPPASEPEPMKLPQVNEEETSVERNSTQQTDQIQTTPALNTTPMVAMSLSDKCYEQTDGSFECVCEGEEECKNLETAEHCEAGTHWGKDGYGGCTKKADK